MSKESERPEEVTALVKVAHEIQIANQSQFEEAKAFILKILAAKKRVGEWWDPVVKKAHEAHREATKARKAALAPLEEAEGFIRPKIANYLEKQRAILQHLDERLQEEAAGRGLPVLESPAFKDENVSTRKVTKYRVTDLMALVKAVAKGKVPIDAVTYDADFLRDITKAMGDKLNYPGVEVYTEESLVVKQ